MLRVVAGTTPAQQGDSMKLLDSKHAAALLPLAVLLMEPAGAQQAEEASAEAQAKPKSVLLEEVVVMARKKAGAESAQRAPLAVTAFSANQFAAVFAEQLEDLGKLAPNVQLTPTTQIGGQNFTIRGMGVTGTTPSDEPAVGIIQDGVYWGVNYGAALDTFDVESVEVLRGPQGTLFGRNVTGGALVVRTARPDGTFDVGAEAVYGNYGRRDLSGSIQGPIIADRLAGKLTVLNRQVDGYFDNLETGKDYGESDSTLVRGTLKFDPTDTLDATVILERYEEDGDSIASYNVSAPGTSAYTLGVRREPGFWDLRLDRPGSSAIDVDSGVLEVNWDLGHGLITSITGYRAVEVNNDTDFDGTPYPFFHQTIGFKQSQRSEEIRYASRFSDRVNFTLGLYYFNQNVAYREGRYLNLGASRLTTGSHQNHESYAAFGEVEARLGDHWAVTVGARYTNERKEADSAPFATATVDCIYDFDQCNFAFGATGKETWSDVSPKFGLTYEFSPTALAYASVTRGFRSGGFSLRGNPLYAPFDAETVTATELGFKSDLLNRRLRLNAAAYRNKFDDLQRTVVGLDPVFGTVQATFNAANATIQGVELELTGQVTDHLVLTGTYGLTEAKYDKAVGFSADKDFVRVPKDNWSATATYSVDLMNLGELQFRASAVYMNSIYFDDANTIREPAYTVYDASVSYASPSGHWNVALFGKNLGDEEYAYWGSKLATWSQIQFNAPPRTFGLRVSYSFQGR